MHLKSRYYSNVVPAVRSSEFLLKLLLRNMETALYKLVCCKIAPLRRAGALKMS